MVTSSAVPARTTEPATPSPFRIYFGISLKQSSVIEAEWLFHLFRNDRAMLHPCGDDYAGGLFVREVQKGDLKFARKPLKEMKYMPGKIVRAAGRVPAPPKHYTGFDGGCAGQYHSQVQLVRGSKGGSGFWETPGLILPARLRPLRSYRGRESAGP